jgi:hypothetical protein
LIYTYCNIFYRKVCVVRTNNSVVASLFVFTKKHFNSGINLANPKQKSFAAETFDGINKGCFESLIGDGGEGDEEDPGAGGNEDP